MTLPPNRSTLASQPTSWKLPVIRQTALVMILLCFIVPIMLMWKGTTSGTRDHEPARTRAAMEVLFAAIEMAPNPPVPLPDAASLADLLPTCGKLAPREGLPPMEDLAEQVALLEERLAQLTAVEGIHNAPLRKRYTLNTAVWAQNVRRSNIECEHAAQALRTLAGPRGGTLLASAQWQEHELRNRAKENAAWGQVQMSAHSLAQSDPWRGWPGCVWVGGSQADSEAYYIATAGRAAWGKLLCEQDGVKPVNAKHVTAAQRWPAGSVPPRDSPAWVVPKDLGALLLELDALKLPEGRLYENYAATLPSGRNHRLVGRNEVDVGFNIYLTIDPHTQTIAQQVAECFSGSVSSCTQTGIDFKKVGSAIGPGASAMWEKAAARMTAVAIIDVATGGIDALASAHTPCYAQENDGPFRDASCLPLWTTPQRRPDALLNHAVFSDYMPGSTVKPIMASVFFEDASTNAADLSVWLAKSNTERFNDELFCFGSGRSPRGSLCDRPARVQRRAIDLGWNVDCEEKPNFRCSSADVLFGRHLSAHLDARETTGIVLADISPIQRGALAGRLFLAANETTKGNAHSLAVLHKFDARAAESCRVGGHWRAGNCNSSVFKPLVNEGDGQGQARSTALGVATMLTRLTAAAYGAKTLRRPYLVQQLTDAQGRPVTTAAMRRDDETSSSLVQEEPINVEAKVAKAVLDAMARGSQPLGDHLGVGTGHLICKHVFGARCAEAGTRIAGKTGTPSFGLDDRSYAHALAFCRSAPRHEHCFQKPVKWYVAAFKSGHGPQDRYDKVIAVMSERNWFLPSKELAGGMQGRVHGVNDLNNISTEIAMRTLDAIWKDSTGLK